jgi:hypothetical protein
MTPRSRKLMATAIQGLRKGWSGFLWMLKILVPISLLTTLLVNSGFLHRLDGILGPMMGILHLPPVAALPLVVGLTAGIYAGIAAMAPLPLSPEQMTLMAIFLLISHNLVQEGVVQDKSGLPMVKAIGFRLAASILTVMVVAPVLDPGHAGVGGATLSRFEIVSPGVLLRTWCVDTLILSIKMFTIIMPLMVLLEGMKSYRLIEGIVKRLAPVLRPLGIKPEMGLLWFTAVLFGVTYGAAVIVEETKNNDFDKRELERLHISIGINHSMIEDPALFLSLGCGPFWLWVPRLVAAIMAVHLHRLAQNVRSRTVPSRSPRNP